MSTYTHSNKSTYTHSDFVEFHTYKIKKKKEKEKVYSFILKLAATMELSHISSLQCASQRIFI